MGTKAPFAVLSGVVGALALTASALPAGAVTAAGAEPTVGFALNAKPATTPAVLGEVALGLSSALVLEISNTGPAGSTLVVPAPPDVDGVPVFPVTTVPAGALAAVAVSTSVAGTPGCAGASLHAGQSCAIGLVVQARQPGTSSATVTFGGNGTATTFTVTLDGVEGYFVASSGGAEAAFDTAGSGATQQPSYVATRTRPLNAPVVATASTQTGAGYYQAAADGGVFSFGDAAFYGSEAGHHLNSPILAMATHNAPIFKTGTGGVNGYWLAAADGGVFSFGDAGFYGSEAGHRLNAPIVAMAATPDGRGYWLAAADGGVFSFGDAAFYGSEAGHRLNAPILSMAATPDGRGYWLAAADGGVFSFGDAAFYGSQAATPLGAPAVAIAATNNGGGYWIETANAATYDHGSAPDVAKGFVGATDDTVAIAAYGDPVLNTVAVNPAAADTAQPGSLSPAAWHGPGSTTS